MSLANVVSLDLNLHLESLDGEIEYPSFVSQLSRAKDTIVIVMGRHISLESATLVLKS